MNCLCLVDVEYEVTVIADQVARHADLECAELRSSSMNCLCVVGVPSPAASASRAARSRCRCCLSYFRGIHAVKTLKSRDAAALRMLAAAVLRAASSHDRCCLSCFSSDLCSQDPSCFGLEGDWNRSGLLDINW